MRSERSGIIHAEERKRDGPDARRWCGPENRRPRPSFSAALAILYFTLDLASDVYVFNIPDARADTDACADASRSHLADHGPPPASPRGRPPPRGRSAALPLISAQIRDPLSALSFSHPGSFFLLSLSLLLVLHACNVSVSFPRASSFSRSLAPRDPLKSLSLCSSRYSFSQATPPTWLASGKR
jgi:hypothetical protein